MLVHDLLDRAAAQCPDRTAVIEPGRSVTYSALADRARAVAAMFISHGVAPGDRVVVALENSSDFVACYFGILMAGAVAVPLPPAARNDRLLTVVDDCTPAACVVDREGLVQLAAARRPSVRLLVVVGSHGRAADAHDAAVVDLASVPDRAPAPGGVRRIDVDLAAIIYTSGSTGVPRGVMLSHLNIASNTSSIVTYLGLTADDSIMVVLPFHYVYGLSLLHTHVAVGGTIVIDNRFAFPNAVLKAMQAHAVTGFAGVPSTFAILLRRSALASIQLPSLRYATQAGGPLPPALAREWRRVMPTVPLVVMYGATEAAARLTYLDPSDLDSHIGSIGRPIPNVDLQVVGDDGTPVPAGETGELVARGSNIASGYWNAPDETRLRFGPAGYRTGDLGYIDADGFIYLVGRRHDMLKIGGHRVSAKEIEDALYDHPAVHEAAVVPVADDVLGEAAAAYVSARAAQTVSASDIIEFCRERLTAYKVPVRVTVLAELPKSASGKIDRAALRQEAVRQMVSL